MNVRSWLVVAALVSLLGCAGADDQPIHVSVLDTAARLGCTDVHVDAPHEAFVAGQGRCRFDGDVVNIRTFYNDAHRDDWLIGVDRFVAHFCRAPGLLLYGERTATADAIAARLGCEVVRHD